MSDIVERLRAWHAPGETITGDVQLYLDAAAEITRLGILVERMTAERDDALVLVGKFNSGAELQTVMRLNNQLVAKVEVLTMKLAKAKTAVTSDKS